MKGELIENRIIVWDIQDSQKLFSDGYYGKPIGIPKPNPDEINVPLVLDLIEGCYLQERAKIKIYKDKETFLKDKFLPKVHALGKGYLKYKFNPKIKNKERRELIKGWSKAIRKTLIH